MPVLQTQQKVDWINTQLRRTRMGSIRNAPFHTVRMANNAVNRSGEVGRTSNGQSFVAARLRLSFAAPGITRDGVSATCIGCSYVLRCFFAWLLWERQSQEEPRIARKDTDGGVLRHFRWPWAGCWIACEG